MSGEDGRDPMCDYTVDPTYLMERHGRTCHCVWTEEQVADIKRRAKEQADVLRPFLD